MRRNINPATFTLVTSFVLIGSASVADEPPPAGGPTQVSPAAQEVIDRAAAAMGGAALFDAVQSVSFDCVMESEQGAMLMKVQARQGSGVLLEQSLTPPGAEEPIRHQVLATNAETGWARDLANEGVQLMPSLVSTSVARAGDQWSFVRSALGQFGVVEHDGAGVFAGRACAKVRFTEPKSPGLAHLTMFFDDETGLPLGQETATASGSLISGTARIDEWQTVDGMMIPKKISVEGQTGQSTFNFTRVEFNTVPASAFTTPNDVKNLMAAASE